MKESKDEYRGADYRSHKTHQYREEVSLHYRSQMI
jgi:hypothetical protein